MRAPINLLLVLSLSTLHCTDAGDTLPAGTGIASDADLYSLITQSQPYTAYTLFPKADSVVSGTLNGSNAHQPTVRVSMNSIALSALSADTLPVGGAFPDGAVIVKEIRENDVTTVFAVLMRDRGNASAGEGWLWAEYTPGGGVLFSINSRGSGCISCHSRERGLQNDLVRTFERQN